MKQPHNFIDEARDTVQQRGTENGYDAGQERSAAKVAAVFNALTGRDLTEQDVWTLLLCLKLVRNQRKYKPDNIVDLIGYAALLGEHLDAGLAHQVAEAVESASSAAQQEAGSGAAGDVLLSGEPLCKAEGVMLDRWAALLQLKRGEGEGDGSLRSRCITARSGKKPRTHQRFA